ncbi:DUF4292 domain-containing protein [bacterium]|nr:DUF4292 domain-containing protein [bacterium]
MTPQIIQQRVAGHFGSLKSFEGKARVIIELPGQGYNGFSDIFLNLPDSIFVKTEAILGIDIGALFLDHRTFGAYAPRDNILYYGEVTKLNLRDFLQVELEIEELYEVFTGSVQVMLDSTSHLALDDGKFLITTPSDSTTLKYWIDPKRFVVTESHLVDSEGTILLTKKFERFQKKNNLQLPKIIRLTRPEARERITVYYTKQTVNRTIPSRQFRLKVPENARKVYWGDIQRPTIDRDRKSTKKQNTNG